MIIGVSTLIGSTVSCPGRKNSKQRGGKRRSNAKKRGAVAGNENLKGGNGGESWIIFVARKPKWRYSCFVYISHDWGMGRWRCCSQPLDWGWRAGQPHPAGRWFQVFSSIDALLPFTCLSDLAQGKERLLAVCFRLGACKFRLSAVSSLSN